MTHIHINSNVLLFDTFNIYILIILRNETIRIGSWVFAICDEKIAVLFNETNMSLS